MPSLVCTDLVFVEQKAQNSDPFKEERIANSERLEIDRERVRKRQKKRSRVANLEETADKV